MIINKYSKGICEVFRPYTNLCKNCCPKRRKKRRVQPEERQGALKSLWIILDEISCDQRASASIFVKVGTSGEKPCVRNPERFGQLMAAFCPFSKNPRVFRCLSPPAKARTPGCYVRELRGWGFIEIDQIFAWFSHVILDDFAMEMVSFCYI